MDLGSLKALNAARHARRAVMLLTDLGEGRERVIAPGDAVEGGLDSAVGDAFRSGKSRVVETGGRKFFLNVHLPPPRLVVIGAVHVSQALAPMAEIAGYDMEIIDPRTAFATQERFPDVRFHAEWPEDVLKARPLDAFTAVAALTHDPKIDDYPLREAILADCFYVGALGSRKTHAARVSRLKATGLSDAQIGRIHAPIGLDIGAASPAEIAVAVLGEVISALRKHGPEQGKTGKA
ncbi:XdhC/CoxF family protein [Phyllobacterium phragmitis]|uniref:XdhC/CoxF family protein n=1 Tax=Phyllobacterium phragmitis TaxID=2670329 RepID=A0A2S9IU30_9HYPH|nr:XdhC family protein [Phyllobacterium phragmitis]PRD44039.1 XdhC/CoxF family protein [Phyllobacterium phragmitis]